MLFMFSSSMEPTLKYQQNLEKVENNAENTSDRESSIESFHTNKSELSITTEAELIDVDDIELSDEESWLYKSPKKQLSEEKSVNTEKWIQKNVDDMSDTELNVTRSALLSKLNQLKVLNSNIEERETKRDTKSTNLTNCDAEMKTTDNTKATSTVSYSKKDLCTPNVENCPSTNMKKESELSNSDQESWKKNEVLDVVDVQKIARLQEESLKQSTYKFLSQSGKKTMSSRDLSPALPVQIVSLNKPASVEALNTCADKMNHSNVYTIVPLHGMKKQELFSSSTLNCSQEFHRGSLPNINKGYYSLKSKRPSEPKVSCPLPIYPSHSKVSLNGTMSQGSFDSHIKSAAPSSDNREARTLPSSYRVHSRSNSSSRRNGNAVLPSPRRESMPFLSNNSMENTSQRDNHRKYSSPTVYPRYNTSSSATISPTKTFNSQTQNLRSPPGLEYYRAASHSPSRRLPLSTVQHQSPRKGSNSLAFPKHEEIRTLKIPSKIPSPGLRSGIPVPSTAYSSRANDEDTWSQDCF